MTITIKKVAKKGYTATVTRPDIGFTWETHAPLTQKQLIRELLTNGCHQTDIGDAFYEADPHWLDRKKS